MTKPQNKAYLRESERFLKKGYTTEKHRAIIDDIPNKKCIKKIKHFIVDFGKKVSFVKPKLIIQQAQKYCNYTI